MTIYDKDGYDYRIREDGFGHMIQMAKAVEKKSGFPTQVHYFDKYRGAYLFVQGMKIWNWVKQSKQHLPCSEVVPSDFIFYIELPFSSQEYRKLRRKEWDGIECRNSTEIARVIQLVHAIRNTSDVRKAQEAFRKLEKTGHLVRGE